MRKIETTVYTFEELSDEAQQNALSNLSDINVDYSWWQWTYDDAANIGLKITAFNLDRNKEASGDFMLSAAEVAANIFQNHGKECSTYKTAENFMQDWQPLFNRYMDEDSEDYESRDLEDDMQDLEDDFLSSLLEDYAQMLQEEYEYLYSEEAIIEAIVANEYEFYENGKLI